MRTLLSAAGVVLAVWLWAALLARAADPTNPPGPTAPPDASATAPASLRFRVEYATYLGGSQFEQPREIIPLADGSVLLGGQTQSEDLPVTPGAAQGAYGGERAGTGHPGVVGGDCFVARLDPAGGRVEFCTYFGGSRQERAVYGMELDAQGNILITTGSRSLDLPTTAGAYQRTYGGGEADVLLAKLSPDGRRVLWCTYIGGKGTDWPRGGLATDGQGNVIVVGESTSADFPASPGAYQRQLKGTNDGMVLKLKADGSALLWATRLGGSDREGLMGARVDRQGNVHVAGHTRSADLPVSPGAAQARPGGQSDAFLACLSGDGSTLRYCTYLGGSGQEFAEHRPALLADGSVLLTGVTGSADFPATPGAFQRRLAGDTDGFLAKLAPDGRTFAFCTLLGGTGGEFFLMPTVDKAGRIYLVGQTSSRDFPVTDGAIQRTYGGGKSDAVLAVLSGDGSRLLYATYLGGRGDDLIRGLALGADGAVYLAGNTDSDDLPFISPSAAQPKRKGGQDGIILKLAPLP